MNRPTYSGRGALVALLCAIVLSALASAAAFAQTGTSSVRGPVADAQGNVVPGATVTLVNTETNAARTQTSNDSGQFVFDLIPPGTYRLEVEARGFKKSVLTDVRALIAKPTEVGVQLEVGAVTESVTVAANSNEELLNTQDASPGNNLGGRSEEHT